MSLIRQVWLLLIGVLLFALLGSIATHTLMARQSLRTQLQVRNHDGAMMLALALSQQRGDDELMRVVTAAQFDTGHYRRVRLLRVDGSVWFERERAPQRGTAPQWFATLLPIEAEPGVAQVSDGWRQIGSVQLSSQAGWAADALWSGSLRMLVWLGLLGVVAALAAAAAVRAWRRPLDATVAQAQALEERRFVLADEPRVPELKRLTRSMNSLVQRLQSLFDSQAAQLDELRQLAHVDAVSGLANRRHFVGQLNAALQSEGRRGAGLLIVRLLDLDAMNRRLGHDGTNRLLAAVAEVLQSYPSHVAGALAGRLNGSDLALYLPATGLAGETARSLCQALRAALATVDQGAELVVGGVDALQASDSASALAAADQALAQAEGRGAFAVQVDASDRGGPAPLGERVWHARIANALQAGRSTLAEFPMLDPNGVLLHLECPLRLQLEADGALEPAARWLPMAVRGRLNAQVDLRALTLALAAIEADGVPRCVNMSAASLASPGFTETVARRLEAAPTQAARLWIDLAEAAARGSATRIQRASARWRRLGVKLGLEHAGGALRELAQLQELGLDCVKIDAAFVQGVAREAPVRDFARGLVHLLRGMQLLVLAEGVDDADDLAALWELGFDGATGPALQRAAA